MRTKRDRIDSENRRCCCCSDDGELFDMLRPHDNGGVSEVYSSMISECFGLEVKAEIYDVHKSLYAMCKMCVVRLRDAFDFKLQIINAYDRIQEFLSSGLDSKNEIVQENDLKTESEEIKIENETISSTESQIFKCKICSEAFGTIQNLKRHSASHFPKYKCDICGKGFLTVGGFRKHKAMHREKIGFTCEICSQTYKMKDSFKAHMKKHNAVYECKYPQCQERFDSAYRRDLHVIKFHRKDSEVPHCKLCDREYSSKSALNHHTKRVHLKTKKKPPSPEDLKCGVCGEIFAWPRNLKLHMAVHTPNYICHVCSKPFVGVSGLRRHLTYHEENKTHTCEICGKVIKDKSNFVRHMRNHGGDSGKYKFKCPQCSEQFDAFDQKSAHMIKVHGDETKIRRCGICDRGFPSSGQLTQHVRRIHLNIRNYACELCNMKFFSKYRLKNHLVTHTGQRDFQCDLCKKSYAKKWGLQCHMKTHVDSF